MALMPSFPVGILAHLSRQSQRPWEVETIFRMRKRRPAKINESQPAGGALDPARLVPDRFTDRFSSALGRADFKVG
jgi:hypothetical protein